jgi:hypothetical protein
MEEKVKHKMEDKGILNFGREREKWNERKEKEKHKMEEKEKHKIGEKERRKM